VYDLSTFGLQQMIESGKQLRTAGQNASSMQDAARSVVGFLHDCFRVGATGEPCCALVRCFKTHPLSTLPAPLKSIAISLLSESNPAQDIQCLVLLASRGDHPGWNSPHTSAHHQVFPLPSARIVHQTPMIARMIVQMGIEIEDIVHPPSSFLLDSGRQPFHVFHVEDALGSEFLPSQETFVIPCRIRSVLGFGGLLPSGELFAFVLFAKVGISRDTAALFRTLALSAKLALLPYAGRQVFDN